jgi:ABC-type nitrate/sulfonate/bicarbonate transport system substrate-binding protein
MLHLTRRDVLVAGIAATTACIGSAHAADIRIEMATGLRATAQSIVWIGTEAGIFRKHGLDIDFVKLEVGGPPSAAGLTRGEWDFVQTGTVPIVEAVLKGEDAVIIARNHVPIASNIIKAKREITGLAQLDGKKVGVLTDVYSGQTGIITRLAIEKAGATAIYVGLGTFQRIHAALVAGEIDAGALQVDYRFVGQQQFGWNVFETGSFGVPSIFATTRRKIASDRATTVAMMRGFVETIHLFKTNPDVVVPLLQSFLRIEDRKAVEDLRTYFAPLMPAVPRAALGTGMQDLHRLFAKRYPAADNLQETRVVDDSIIGEVESSGFIDRLYADGKR